MHCLHPLCMAADNTTMFVIYFIKGRKKCRCVIVMPEQTEAFQYSGYSQKVIIADCFSCARLLTLSNGLLKSKISGIEHLHYSGIGPLKTIQIHVRVTQSLKIGGIACLIRKHRTLAAG
jgi:hypothetical protein